MTAVTSVCIKEKLVRIGGFLCSHFNIEEEENTHFQHIMLYNFKKGKNKTEMQKKFMQCIEKVL